MPMIESFDEFQRRQGCPYAVVRKRYLFENGAQWVAPGHTYEPPADTKDNLLLRREYLRHILSEERNAFNSFKSDCLELAAKHVQYPNLPGPGPHAVEQLKAGKARCEAVAEKLEVVETALRPFLQESLADARMKADLKAEAERQLKAVVDEIRAIEV